MKIGILTFHSAYNFGAVLQCHGLYETLRSLGHDVSVIDYRPSYLFFPRPRLGIGSFVLRPLKTLRALPFVFSYSRYYDRFETFVNKYWALSETITNCEILGKQVNEYDCIVVGSDQVWNKVHNGNDNVWYGIDRAKKSVRWITYAASAGDSVFDSDEVRRFEKSFNLFDYISVREEKLKNILSALKGSPSIVTVLDPTLLADEIVWCKWYKPIIKGKYIVIYQARPDDNVFRIANSLADELGVKKIIVLDNHANVKTNGHKQYPASPSDFISIIKNATCVVTTSFHGTAFSIITETPFYTLCLNDGADERSYNLLCQLNLTDRFISMSASPRYREIDFVPVKESLRQLRTFSICYLKEALS